MSDLFREFKSSTAEEWKNQMIKDLKGKDHSILEFENPIEELEFKAYYHAEEVPATDEIPGTYPFTRGLKTESNEWSNGYFISVSNASEANKEALNALMTGADLLVFKAATSVGWKQVLNAIQFEYIKLQFDVSSLEDCFAIRAIVGDAIQNVSFNFDPLNSSIACEELGAISKKEQTAVALVNGFEIQQAGATTWQEIAFCLNVGHEYLIRFMNQGFTIDKAAALIHFHVGIGNLYFHEIAKLRALRMLWSKIIQAYEPKDFSSYNCNITSVIGHSNKSLRDPFTNLLRQTTETMSASNGSNAILVLPYDLYSQTGSTELAKRMALNISLILKEESYLNTVIDPTGGSYSVEKLTELIGRKAWESFQKIETLGGLFSAQAADTFRAEVQFKQAQRIEAYQNGTNVNIGMNKYPDPNEREANWVERPKYFGLAPMVLDVASKINAV